MRVIQVIPLFAKVNEVASAYFREHRAEIDAITGTHVIVALPETVLQGDAGDVYSAAGSKRYPGLGLANLPCLWIEGTGGNFVWPMPDKKEQINKVLAVLTDAARETSDWGAFKKSVEAKMSEHLPESRTGSWNPYTILKDSIRAVPAMKYALGVLGLVAVVAIISAWRIEYKVAVFGAVVILILMVAVLVFAKLTQVAPKHFLLPAKVFMWAFVLLTIATGTSLFTAAAIKWPPAFYELIFSKPTVAPKTEPVAETKSPPEFLTRVIIPTIGIERSEFNLEPGSLPAEGADEFLRLTRLAFGTADQTNQAFQVDLTIKNTSDRTMLLDLSDRFFSMADDKGRSAELLYFCCPSRGETLAPGQERVVQLFFKDVGWHGKGISASWINFRVQGFLPVVSAVWKVRPLATAN